LLGDKPEELRHLLDASTDPESEEVPVDTFGETREQQILVIEDNVWEARLMRRLFESRKRFEVIEAYSAADALAEIQHSKPDLIVLDLLLPDIDGEHLLSTLRVDPQARKIPVVIVTGKELTPAERAQVAKSVDSIWFKSTLERSTLLSHIENLLSE
jgi:CheY-like chemotaxis protein